MIRAIITDIIGALCVFATPFVMFYIVYGLGWA
jgi:hypothetical protein